MIAMTQKGEEYATHESQILIFTFSALHEILWGCVEVYLKKLYFAGRVYFYLPQNKMFGFVRGILIKKICQRA
jgi:hypothetical protein